MSSYANPNRQRAISLDAVLLNGRSDATPCGHVDGEGMKCKLPRIYYPHLNKEGPACVGHDEVVRTKVRRAKQAERLRQKRARLAQRSAA